MKEYAEQTLTREAKSYIQPLQIAQHLADRAFQKGNKNAAYDAQASLVFLAFTIEAFCNHVGWKLVPNFSDFDKLRVLDKLRKTAELSGYTMSLGKRPFQTFIEVMCFRDEMAHPKTQKLISERQVPRPTFDTPIEIPKTRLTKREAYCTPEILKRALEDIPKGLNLMYNCSTLAEECPFEKENKKFTMSWKLERMKTESK